MKLKKRILSLACAFALVVGMVVTAPGAFAAEGQWVEKAPMPRDIFAFSTATLNKKIYVMGGTSSPTSGALSSVDIYDTTTNQWEKVLHCLLCGRDKTALQ